MSNRIVAVRHDCDGTGMYTIDGAVETTGVVLWKYPGNALPYTSAKFCAHCGVELPLMIEREAKP